MKIRVPPLNFKEDTVTRKACFLKILHVPCNTPYIRKLKIAGGMGIANGAVLQDGTIVPMEITYRWILEQRENTMFWDSFDICHLHYGFEFESIEVVENALSLLRERKPIVYTCHELHSMHGVPQERYAGYLALIVESADAVITLTDHAKNALLGAYPKLPNTTVVPHGYVVPPDDPSFGGKRSNDKLPEILFFGALRANRDTTTSIVNILADSSLACRIGWVTRPFTQEQLSTSPILRTALELSKNNDRVHIELTLPLTDEEVILRVEISNVTVLPYLFAGHSGQLEMAFDCGLLPVITDVGFLDSQWKAWPEESTKVPRAIVVRWSDEKKWLYQARLLNAVHESLALLPTFASSIDVEARRQFRTREHKQVLERHLAVYSAAIQGGKR